MAPSENLVNWRAGEGGGGLGATRDHVWLTLWYFCTVQAMCSEANKKKACDEAKKGSQQAGITMENCEIKCCSEDKCNDLDLEGPTDGTVSFRATSFFITFLSVTAISAGFFIH